MSFCEVVEDEYRFVFYKRIADMQGMIHNYEITVKAYDEKDTVIGIGKNAKKFLH